MIHQATENPKNSLEGLQHTYYTLTWYPRTPSRKLGFSPYPQGVCTAHLKHSSFYKPCMGYHSQFSARLSLRMRKALLHPSPTKKIITSH